MATRATCHKPTQRISAGFAVAVGIAAGFACLLGLYLGMTS